MDAETKANIRKIVKIVHPDRFSKWDVEQSQNNEALKNLLLFLESIVEGEVVRSCVINFWIFEEQNKTKQKKKLKRVTVELSGRDSLGKLFDAFGIPHLKPAKVQSGENVDLVAYLKTQISTAVELSERFRTLNAVAKRAKSDIIESYNLSELRFADLPMSTDSLLWQISALQMLSDALNVLDKENLASFSNQKVVLHRERKRSHSSFQGSELHLVVNRNLKSQLRKIDAKLLGTLSKLNAYWTKRISVLLPLVKSTLSVKAVLGDFIYSGDGYGNSSAEAAVLWAGKILKAKAAFDKGLRGEVWAYSILVHSDHSTPYVDMLKTSTMLQVRSDCPPAALLAFMCSPEAKAFNEQVKVVEGHRETESRHLSNVKKALKLKQMLRICSFANFHHFEEACTRLVQASSYINQHVDLRGVSLAIDDCYEVWESGFISIPYDFDIEDLCQNLQESLPLQRKAPNLLLENLPPLDAGGRQHTRRETASRAYTSSRPHSRMDRKNAFVKFQATQRMARLGKFTKLSLL